MVEQYPASTLIKRAGKGGKYYVCVTIPEPLRKGTQRQMMRSTGTSDLRIAKTLQHAKTAEIYAELDRRQEKIYREYSQDTQKILYTNQISANPREVFTANSLIIQKYGLDKNPEHKILRLLPRWIEHLEATGQGNVKERRSRENKLKEFAQLVGNLHVEDIKKKQAYDYAGTLNAEGKANKTIRSLITKVSAFLTWCEQQGHVEENPFVNLRLSTYGTQSLPYLPFEPEELVDIFAQQMVHRDRLCLSLLAVTGARLDEIALLDWSQVKTEHSITYLDLRPDAARVKTDGSHRVIPVHSALSHHLMGGSGPIFDFIRDRDGKAQSDASKRLMPYIRAITSDSRKAVHSFRGTFKQMLENAGITNDVIGKLESGEATLQEIQQTLQENRVDKRVNDKITGHSARDVAGKYGFGPLLIPRAAAVEKLNVEFLNLQALDVSSG